MEPDPNCTIFGTGSGIKRGGLELEGVLPKAKNKLPHRKENLFCQLHLTSNEYNCEKIKVRVSRFKKLNTKLMILKKIRFQNGRGPPSI